ncbi:MAG: ribonuclease R [Candidatus Pacebacteria bacterium]|nr:ribonuclease R [Candidatus Paceibacterota bacterium]MCF7857011.1 ribonuclease R [Candidatus Paceibacterota bacterium]
MEAEKSIFEGVIMIRGKGTGFVAVPNYEEDILIPTEALSFALDGDIVEFEIGKKVPGKRQEGKVLRVIDRKYTEFIGSVQKKAGVYRLLPDNRRIHIRPLLPDATTTHEGMKVVVHIKAWESPLADPTGTITEILGPAGDHETEMQAIIRGGGFSENFPEPIAKAGQELYARKEAIFAQAVLDTQGEKPKRRDMRDRTTCTIDPADAKDFDDAISFHALENGNYEVGIHIADVSHYVREDDIIDKEAQSRGTSIYLVDRVIPMLPEVLSNDLCSLRPNEDRLSFSAVFEMDAQGKIHNEWYGQTIIHSDKRFSYEEAQEVLDSGKGPLHTELSTLMSIGRMLRKQRFVDGAIAFDQPEVRFELDAEGKPLRVYAKVRTETMLMIEDFMLLANRRVAEFVHSHTKKLGRDAAFVYRVHDLPNPEKIEDLTIFLHALGHEFKSNKGIVDARDINKLLKSIEGTPEENLIKTATIRSMAKAIYTTKNIGHYGLAFKYYTHFTSPIRRYPDLMAHRLLRRHLDGSVIKSSEIIKFEKLSIQSSEREMTAVTAERDSIKYKQVEYMLDKVGQEFDGIITGVTDWGMYVEVKETRCEGMIRLSSMKSDFFTHESSKYRVKGNRTGKTYSLGGGIRIKLTRADMEERVLDFELA